MKIVLSLLITTILGCTSMHAQEVLYTRDRNLPCIERKFYVYVHIILDSLRQPGISDEKIKAHLAEANKAFEPLCISFDYCKADTVRDYSFNEINAKDEIELLFTRFQKKRRINIYYSDFVISEQTNSFSFFNGISSIDSAAIFLPKSGVGWVHELGHTFGLYHIFEKKFGFEKVDGTDCATTGDMICDTPAAIDVFHDKKTCEYYGNTIDVNGDYYKMELGNFMSHYFCAHCFFTTEQYEKMASNFLNAPIKLW